jgi:hypothetical protein
MKKIISILVFSFISMITFAQKEIKEMHVVYSIADIEVKDDSKSAAKKAMKGTEIEIYYADGKQKMNMEMMMGLMKMQFFFDPKAKTCNMFMDVMGQKTEMTDMDSTYRYSIEHRDEIAKKSKPMSPPKATGVKKEILKYNCEEYLVKGDEKMKSIRFFVAKDLKIDKSIWEASKNSNMGIMPDGSVVDGFPLEMIMESEEMTMTLRATKFETKVDQKEFVKPEGYTKKSSKNMKGRMGF